MKSYVLAMVLWVIMGCCAGAAMKLSKLFEPFLGCHEDSDDGIPVLGTFLMWLMGIIFLGPWEGDLNYVWFMVLGAALIISEQLVFTSKDTLDKAVFLGIAVGSCFELNKLGNSLILPSVSLGDMAVYVAAWLIGIVVNTYVDCASSLKSDCEVECTDPQAEEIAELMRKYRD